MRGLRGGGKESYEGRREGDTETSRDAGKGRNCPSGCVGLGGPEPGGERDGGKTIDSIPSSA